MLIPMQTVNCTILIQSCWFSSRRKTSLKNIFSWDAYVTTLMLQSGKTGASPYKYIKMCRCALYVSCEAPAKPSKSVQDNQILKVWKLRPFLQRGLSKMYTFNVPFPHGTASSNCVICHCTDCLQRSAWPEPYRKWCKSRTMDSLTCMKAPRRLLMGPSSLSTNNVLLSLKNGGEMKWEWDLLWNFEFFFLFL